MTPTREQVIEWARASGAIEMRENALNTEHFPWGCEMEIDNLLSFAALAYSAGRLNGLEEAKTECEKAAEEWPCPSHGNAAARLCAAAIGQLKEQK